jgi:hypothetical protein
MMATLLLHAHGAVLPLLEDLHVACALVQHGFGGGIQVGAELAEGLQFAVGGLVQLQRAGHLLHALDLCVAAHAAHADTHVDGGAYTAEEEVALQEDLSIGDGDHVGGDVGDTSPAWVSMMGRAVREPPPFTLPFKAAGRSFMLFGHCLVLGDLGGALQQAAVQVEHIARIGLASRRAAQQQGDLAVGHGLLG